MLRVTEDYWVNTDFIESVRILPNGDGEIVMASGQKVRMPTARFQTFLYWLERQKDASDAEA